MVVLEYTLVTGLVIRSLFLLKIIPGPWHSTNPVKKNRQVKKRVQKFLNYWNICKDNRSSSPLASQTQLFNIVSLLLFYFVVHSIIEKLGAEPT